MLDNFWLSTYDPHVEGYCFEHGYVALGYGGDIDYSGVPNDKSWSVAWNAIEKLMNDNNYERKSRFPIQVMSWFKTFINIGDIIIVSKGMSKAQAIGVVIGEYEYRPNEIPGYAHFRKVDWIIKDADIPVEKIQNRKFSGTLHIRPKVVDSLAVKKIFTHKAAFRIS